MQSFNFINFIRIVDLSILNFIDYLDVIDNSFTFNEYGQMVINLNAKGKKLLTEFIINNINDNLQYGKVNVIINTCKPMQNWRQIARNKAIRSYKYKFMDESIQIDEIKFNQFLDSIYKKLEKISINNCNYDSENYIHFNKLKNKVKCLSFEELDIWDSYGILKLLLKDIGTISFDILNYTTIIDGNYEYAHDMVFDEDILESVRLELLKKEII